MKELYIIFLAVVSLLLLVEILRWGNYLSENNYIEEQFENQNSIDKGDPSTSHSVDLPLTTTISCKNMCGPVGRCSITGEQCSTDVDCYGCQPTKPQKKVIVRGQNDAGNLTTKVQPNYSTLTTDIGTRAKLYNDKLIDPPQYMQGINTWRSNFDKGEKLYNERYAPKENKNMTNYPPRKTLSGQFIDNGPLPSNAYM